MIVVIKCLTVTMINCVAMTNCLSQLLQQPSTFSQIVHHCLLNRIIICLAKDQNKQLFISIATYPRLLPIEALIICSHLSFEILLNESNDNISAAVLKTTHIFLVWPVLNFIRLAYLIVFF